MSVDVPCTAARTRWHLVLMLAALPGAGLATPALAQTAAPPPPTVPTISQEVFVTATVSTVPTGSLTRTATMLTRQDLERMGITSVVDALRLVPGLDPRARGPHDIQTDLSVRGSTFGQNLVLVDGFRINNSQSGHHNGEFPVAIEGIDRIEVLYGAASAVHGADALGGTINVISRRGTYAGLTAETGQHGLASTEGSISGHGLPENWSATGWASRSDGFMFDREFAQGGAAIRGALTRDLTIDVRHQRRAFGANGFYGASPSKEWTNQSIAALTWQHADGPWVAVVKGQVRAHHDHFRWDIARPGFAENRHQTEAGEFTASIERSLAHGVRATGGISAGRDEITSSNLKDHDYTRTSVFGEVLAPVTTRATVQGGVRIDRYSNFGQSVSPSVSMAAHVTPDLRLHVATGHAFRIPSFTELYYSDPANLGNPDLRAETGWSLDAGADWSRGGWTMSVTPFRRWDHDVIDWVKPTAPDLWRTTNVRDVTSTGVELSVARRLSKAWVRAHYSALSVDAPALNQLSKYVLEYAKRQAGVSLSIPVIYGVRAALNVDHRDRLDGQSYELVGLKINRPIGRADVFIDGTNLFNETYHEVAGVDMPGRWLTVGVSIR